MAAKRPKVRDLKLSQFDLPLGDHVFPAYSDFTVVQVCTKYPNVFKPKEILTLRHWTQTMYLVVKP